MSVSIDGRMTIPIGPDKTPTSPYSTIVILGTKLTPEQASVLRELVRAACAINVPAHDHQEAGWNRVCGELYQLIKGIR